MSYDAIVIGAGHNGLVAALTDATPELLFEVALDVGIIDLAIADGAVDAATARGLMAVDIGGIAY